MDRQPTLPHRTRVMDIPRGVRGPVMATINALIWDPSGDLTVQLYFMLPRESLPPGSDHYEHWVFLECYAMTAWHYETHRPGVPWPW